MQSPYITVGGVKPTAKDTTNLRDEVFSFALDQRAFDPRKLLVAFADADGTFRGMAETDRRDAPEESLAACIQHVGLGSAAAVAFCDERVDEEPPADVAERFARAREICASYGVHLVDWFMCDDLSLRSVRYTVDPDSKWWDVGVS